MEDNYDFSPKIGAKALKKAISVTLSIESAQLIERLQKDYSINVSKYIDELLKSVIINQNLEPSSYPLALKEYRECRLLLRREVADFIDSWNNLGVCNNLYSNGKLVDKSTPLEISRKISFILANDPEFQLCDKNIYGYLDESIEKVFQKIDRIANR